MVPYNEGHHPVIRTDTILLFVDFQVSVKDGFKNRFHRIFKTFPEIRQFPVVRPDSRVYLLQNFFIFPFVPSPDFRKAITQAVGRCGIPEEFIRIAEGHQIPYKICLILSGITQLMTHLMAANHGMPENRELMVYLGFPSERIQIAPVAHIGKQGTEEGRFQTGGIVG
jgi:hypothetical protein